MEYRVPKSAKGLGGSAWHAGCCHVDRAEADRLVPGNTRVPGSVVVEAENKSSSPAVSARTWQSWFKDWEERQRVLLLRQQEALQEVTKECVRALKEELLEKLEKLEKLGDASSVRRSGTIVERLMAARSHGGHGIPPIREDSVDTFDMRVSHPLATGPNGRGPGTPEGGLNFGVRSSAMSGAASKNLNDAMSSVIGAHKRKESRCVTTSFYSKEFADSMGLLESERSNWQPEGKFRRIIFEVVQHPCFCYSSGFLVMLYAVAAGMMSDIEMRAALKNEPSPDWRWYVDGAFTAAFIVECCLKLGSDGRHYFRAKDWSWNVFDLVVAFIGLLDVIIVSTVNLGFLRVLRTFRAIRVLRIVRIFSFFKELRLMVASILCCLVSLTSAFALMIAVMYIFAVILLQSASELIRDTGGTTEGMEVLKNSFGSMLLTVYSLTQAVSGGRSWGEFAQPFIELNPWYGALFTSFVAFVIFGILNILTGVFVESTASLASVDKELVIQEELARNQSAINQMRRLFKEIDADQSGTLSYAELKKNLKDERVKAYFAVLQMDVSEAHGLFQLLDRDESGEVSIEEFIMTCLRLKGAARSIDMATMLAENKRLHHALKNFMAVSQANFWEIQVKLKALMAWLDDGPLPDYHTVKH